MKIKHILFLENKGDKILQLKHWINIVWLFLKVDLLCENHFYKVFEDSCVTAVCDNNQPIMLKIHPLIFL